MIMRFFALLIALIACSIPLAASAREPAHVTRPAALDPATWLDAPDTSPGNRSLARYRRVEADGSNSILNLTYETCNCTPSDMAQTLRVQLASAGVDPQNIAISDAKMCGLPAARVAAADVAAVSNNVLNFDAYIFGTHGTRYVIFYFYGGKSPRADVQRLIPALCPASA